MRFSLLRFPGFWFAITCHQRPQIGSKTRDDMPRILMTGAAGEIGTRLRNLLPPVYPDLVLSDVKTTAELSAAEASKAAAFADLAEVETICDGGDGILHFGGFSVEGRGDTILQSNINGCYN